VRCELGDAPIRRQKTGVRLQTEGDHSKVEEPQKKDDLTGPRVKKGKGGQEIAKTSLGAKGK